MYTFSDDVSKSSKVIIATGATKTNREDYRFRKLTYPNISFRNWSTGWRLDGLPEDSEEKTKLRNDVLTYNEYLTQLENIPGFLSFFLENNLCVSKKRVAEKWSDAVAETVFSKRYYCFETDLSVVDEWLFDNTNPLEYRVTIDGINLFLPIGKDSDAYPAHIGDKQLIWNYIDIGHDFCISIWELLGARNRRDDDWEDEDSDDGVSYFFEAYHQIRYDYVEPQLVRIFKKLETLGYLESYTIVPEQEDPRWKWYGKSDGSIDCAVIDPAFTKNKLIMEQIEILMWTKADELTEKPYCLTSSKDKQYLSESPGELGGHKKLKIYGRLDCPGAARFIAKGQYAQHRVFFANEETAISAGYRPCGNCMKAEYKLWKEMKKAGLETEWREKRLLDASNKT